MRSTLDPETRRISSEDQYTGIVCGNAKRRIERRLDGAREDRGRPMFAASEHPRRVGRQGAGHRRRAGSAWCTSWPARVGPGRGHRPPPAPAEDPSALPRVGPRAEPGLQRPVRRHAAGGHRAAAQRRGLPRRPGRGADSRPDHGGRLLPPLRRSGHPQPDAGDRRGPA